MEGVFENDPVRYPCAKRSILRVNDAIAKLSENSYLLISKGVAVELLSRLFPGFSNDSHSVVPDWSGFLNPWEILTTEEGGLQSQIYGLSGEKDGVFIHPSAKIGEGVVFEGPCFVGEDSEIRHSAYLRKGSWICSGALVGHSTEIKNSILLPNAKAPHFNYVGDSILGYDVNLGAGAKLSNVRNDGGNIPLILEGVRIDSGMKKLGALIGDRSRIGCNVVSNPGAIISPGAMIRPNQTVSGWV